MKRLYTIIGGIDYKVEYIKLGNHIPLIFVNHSELKKRTGFNFKEEDGRGNVPFPMASKYYTELVLKEVK